MSHKNGLLTLTLSALLATIALGATNEAVTFSKDVAPLFFSKCASCHRPGEIAPMSLLTYDDARPWARSIARAVRSREMPPWGAAPRIPVTIAVLLVHPIKG